MELLIIVIVLFSIGITYFNARWGLPVLVVINHWLRWGLFSVGFAYVATWLSEPEMSRPFWLLWFTGFLVYLLFETIYNWLAISVLSRSGLALFPKFRSNVEGDEWPSHKRYLHVRDWIRAHEFEQTQSIKAQLDEGVYIRSSVYQQESQKIRLQVLFIPQRTGALSMSYVFFSVTESGARYITDNVNMPFGGFYPENWQITRKPMTRSIEGLFKQHVERMQQSSENFVSWEGNPLDDLNQQQRQLESTNMRLGFLFPYDMQEEHGKITGEGRYRLWKEIWLLNYLGMTVKS